MTRDKDDMNDFIDLIQMNNDLLESIKHILWTRKPLMMDFRFTGKR